MAEIEKTFDYYHSRVLEVVRLSREGDLISLALGKEKIKDLLEEYKKFSQHNSFLTSAISDIVLREN